MTQAAWNLLIVDDESTDRLLLRRLLSPEHTVAEARDGEAAIALLESGFEPDCVLLDYHIPGTEITSLISVLASQWIPVVMITGANNPEAVVACMKAGSQDYLVKSSISLANLHASLAFAITVVRHRREEEESRSRIGKMYERAKEQRDELQAAMWVARDVQRNLLPAELPVTTKHLDVAGLYVPSEETSGDFYDFVSFGSEDSIGLLLGDVSGHGIGAALLSAELRAYVRALAQTITNVSDVLATANQLFCDDVSEGQFATAILVRIDLVSFTLTYAGAGHHGDIVHADGSVTELPSTGLPLGLIRDADYPPPATIHLVRSDLLLLKTDGCWEQRNQRQEILGRARCRKDIIEHRHLSAEKLVHRVYQNAMEFADSVPASDDIAVVAAKRLA